MASSAQLDLFPEEALVAPAPSWKPPAFAPYPHALLRRLGATLRMLQRAVAWPWPEALVEGEVRQFLACIERLPPDMRGDLAESFQAEIARLRQPCRT